MIIALCIIGYFIVGFGVAMIYAFIRKRWNQWDTYNDSNFCVELILFYPILISIGIIIFIIEELKDFFEWFVNCINEKE